jgi:hypothetical protein
LSVIAHEAFGIMETFGFSKPQPAHPVVARFPHTGRRCPDHAG